MATINTERRYGGLLMLVAALVFAAIVLANLMRVEPLRVFDAHFESDGNQVYVEGRVKNTGKEQKDASLEVRYFDAGGRVVGEDTVTLSPLSSGSEATFQSPPRPRGEIRDFTVQVSRGRDPYGN